MKGLVNFVLKNKLAVWLLTFIITASGIYSGTRMKMEAIPDISIPYLIVVTVNPGATPEQIMDELSIPLEKAVESLKDVKSVYSNSSNSVSQIQIEYEYGVDMIDKKRELESVLGSIDLPENVQKPSIMTISLNMMPVVALSVSSSTEDIVDLTSRVESIIIPELNKIDGVASATVTGQHVEQVEFSFKQDKLEEYNLSEDTIKDLLKASNMYLSLGLLEFKDSEEAIAIDGTFKSVDELKNMLIPVTPTLNQPSPTIPLEEVADIQTVGLVDSVSRTNGEDSITIQIIKGQDANTVTVVNEVKDLIQSLKDENKGLSIDVTLDQAKPIEESILTMVEKAIFGGLIAILIILLFLRDFKSTIISIISIPVSIFMALLLLNWLDITLNIMTLGAITVAIGRVIDDSIVVVENIYRRMHKKDEKLQGRALIREATIEMFKPILSSTLVTVAVFAPLVFVGGMVGELFLPFALTMSFALIASLIVAITIVPTLSHSLFKTKIYGQKQESLHKEAGKLANWYKQFLEKVLNRKLLTSIIALVLLVGSFGLVPLIGFSFIGSQVNKTMYIAYTPKTGEVEATTLKAIEEVEKELMAYEEIDIVQLTMASKTAGATDLVSSVMNDSSALLFLVFDSSMSDDEFIQKKKEINTYLENLNHAGKWKEQDMMSMGLSSNQVSYTIHSENLDDLLTAVKQIEDTLVTIDGLEEVTSGAQNPFTEHTFKVDQAHVLQYGLTTGQLIMSLYQSTPDEILTTIENNGKELNVILQGSAKEAPTSLDDILSIMVPTPVGLVPFSELVTVEEGTMLNKLTRSEGTFYTSVQATIMDKDISKATAKADEKINELSFPEGVKIGVSGVTADMQETFSQLGVAMIAAILIVYFILVVTFGEGLAPFAILFSLPFTIIGSFVGLWITNQTISVSVMMGLLMLIGIVVTNAIVLVDRIIRMEKEGLPMREAILEAGSTRLRPILMTAIATIGAMLPMALGVGGGGGLITKDLAVTVIGGLITSTALTLVIVPIVYELLSKLLKKNRKEIIEN